MRALAALALIAASSLANAASLDDIRRSGVLKVCIVPNYAGISLRDPRTGQLGGFDIDMSKQQQSSDWATATLSEAQIAYAASDVLHLHRLRERLDDMLRREGRAELAEACFRFLPHRALLDVEGWEDMDIFAHA